MSTLPVDIESLKAVADALDRASQDDEDGAYEVKRRLYQHATEVRLFAAVAIGEAGRVDQVSWLGALLEQLEHRDPVDPHDQPIEEAIAALLERLPADDPRWARYAKAPDPRLRRAVAQSASTSHSAGAAWIEALRRDPDEAVRAVARGRPLEAPIDWWSAAFSFDPWTVVPREARAGLEGALRVVVEAAELRPHQRRNNGEVLAVALMSLPGALARDALQRFLSGQRFHVAWTTPVLSHLVAEPGGGAWLWRQLAAQEELAYSLPLETILGGVPATTRASALLELTREVAAVGRARASDTMGWRVMQAVAATWPEDEDPRPVAGVLAARADAAHDSLHSVVGELLARPAHAHHVAPQLLAEQEAGRGLVMTFLDRRAAAVIAAAPASVVRPYALRALDADDVARRRWAVIELLGRAHDPTVDPSPEARAAELLARAGTRTIVLRERPDLVAGLLLARQQGGQALRVDEASALVRARGSRSARARLDESDWTALRLVRHAAIVAREAADVSSLFPRARWTAADWDDYDALLALDAAEAGRALAILERQTVRRAEGALVALAEAAPGCGAVAALDRWRAFHD